METMEEHYKASHWWMEQLKSLTISYKQKQGATIPTTRDRRKKGSTILTKTAKIKELKDLYATKIASIKEDNDDLLK